MANNGQQQNPDGIINKVLKVAAYPVSGFIGWWVSRNQIRHYTFEKLNDRGGLSDVIDDVEHGDAKLKEITLEAVKKIKQPGVMVDLGKEGRPVEKRYTAAIRERFERLGLNTVGKQSEYIYKPQFHKALLEGFTALSISLGAMLILANSKSLSKAFRDAESRDNTNQPS